MAMQTRRFLTAAATVVALTVGAGSAALATPRGAHPELPPVEAMCRRAEHRLAELTHRQDQFEAKQARLQVRLDQAVADGDTRRAARLQAQLDTVQRMLDRLAGEIADTEGFLAAQCVVEPPQYS